MEDIRGSQIEWDMFREGFIHYYHRCDLLREDIGKFEEAGYTVFEISCKPCASADDFFGAANEALSLRDFAYLGRNVAAFDDRLCQLELPERAVFVFWNYDEFMNCEALNAQYVLEVLTDFSRINLLLNKRLIHLLQIDTPDVQFKAEVYLALQARSEHFAKGREVLERLRRKK